MGANHGMILVDVAPGKTADFRAVVKPGQRERYADVLDRVEVWEHEPSAADLDGFAAAVEASDRS